jgi:dGTPase
MGIGMGPDAGTGPGAGPCAGGAGPGPGEAPARVGPTERSVRWAATMAGYSGPVRLAHADSHARIAAPPAEPAGAPPDGSRGPGARGHPQAPNDRSEREDLEAVLLAPGATRSSGAGARARPEEADRWRTCFERDRDRILHATSFRRLAGKTQVFVFPEDHMRTRLTHALEVAQVAAAIARTCRLNVALTEAIALGHDCGHGPGGHASEDALDPYLPEGFDHAPWGARVSLAPLNLCAETLDGVANHSWSRPAPSTPEGEVVSWADRIAYVCHDWEDAVRAGIVVPHQLPPVVRSLCGEERSEQLGVFIGGVVSATLRTGQVGMEEGPAEALATFRSCNYERIYLREASLRQGEAVVGVLRALVEHFADRPHLVGDAVTVLPEAGEVDVVAGSPEAVRAAVTYVAGMTDRYAFRQAVASLGWDPAKLPTGVDG